jgi:preprotein translocase subunit SecE
VAFEIYKNAQGKYTRWVTFGAGTLIGVLIAHYVWTILTATLAPEWAYRNYVIFGVPLVIFLALGWMMFRIINNPKAADFMIATESEMKKVSWSNRREIIGGTKVVIATTLILAAVLWAVDFAFSMFFDWMGVLPLGAGGGG